MESKKTTNEKKKRKKTKIPERTSGKKFRLTQQGKSGSASAKLLYEGS